MTPKPSTPEASPEDSPNGMPYWLPPHPEGKDLPPAIRRAVAAVLRPLYQGLVLNAPDELERSTGLTVVHLAWLEVCDQVSMAAHSTDPSSLLAVLDDFQQRVNRHLELVDAKCRATELLLRIRTGSQLVQSIQSQLTRNTPAPLTLTLAEEETEEPGHETGEKS